MCTNITNIAGARDFEVMSDKCVVRSSENCNDITTILIDAHDKKSMQWKITLHDFFSKHIFFCSKEVTQNISSSLDKSRKISSNTV
jgi:hypothetical protein